MPDVPTNTQFALALIAAGWFAASVIYSIARPNRRSVPMVLSLIGLGFGVASLISHSFGREYWAPLDDNFDSLLVLAVLIACVSLYLQTRRKMGRVDWVLSPIVVLLLVGAAVFGKTMPRSYSHGLWMSTHLTAVFVGSIAFALAAACAVMYLLLNRRLRNKHLPVDASYGSLEKLENVMYWAVTIGFALMSVGLVLGVTRAASMQTRLGTNWFWQPKVILATLAYVLYALVLHSPINPAFRGRRTAVLSIAGFVLLLGTIAAVQVIK